MWGVYTILNFYENVIFSLKTLSDFCSSWESKGTPMPPPSPPENKALLGDDEGTMMGFITP